MHVWQGHHDCRGPSSVLIPHFPAGKDIMIPTTQNICGPLCGYTIEELRAQSMWAPDKTQVRSGWRNASGCRTKMAGCLHFSFHAPYNDVREAHVRICWLHTDARSPPHFFVLLLLLLLRLHSPACLPSCPSPPQDLAVAMDARRDTLMFFAGTMDGIGGPQVG